jgi:hypothetical protein
MQQVQCKACGRQHKWREEMAGSEFLCHCGEWVYCPAPGDKEYIDEVEPVSKADALARENEFVVDHGFETSAGSGGGSAIVATPPEDIEDISADVGELDLSESGEAEALAGAGRGRARKRRVRAASSRGLLGLTAFAELCVWIVGSMVGFTFTLLAVMNPSHVEYIVLAALFGPPSWWMLRKSYLVWKRGRRLVIAIDDQLTSGENAAP